MDKISLSQPRTPSRTNTPDSPAKPKEEDSLFVATKTNKFDRPKEESTHSTVAKSNKHIAKKTKSGNIFSTFPGFLKRPIYSNLDEAGFIKLTKTHKIFLNDPDFWRFRLSNTFGININLDSDIESDKKLFNSLHNDFNNKYKQADFKFLLQKFVQLTNDLLKLTDHNHYDYDDSKKTELKNSIMNLVKQNRELFQALNPDFKEDRRSVLILVRNLVKQKNEFKDAEYCVCSQDITNITNLLLNYYKKIPECVGLFKLGFLPRYDMNGYMDNRLITGIKNTDLQYIKYLVFEKGMSLEEAKQINTNSLKCIKYLVSEKGMSLEEAKQITDGLSDDQRYGVVDVGLSINDVKKFSSFHINVKTSAVLVILKEFGTIFTVDDFIGLQQFHEGHIVEMVDLINKSIEPREAFQKISNKHITNKHINTAL